jgi:hypothetical protein
LCAYRVLLRLNVMTGVPLVLSRAPWRPTPCRLDDSQVLQELHRPQRGLPAWVVAGPALSARAVMATAARGCRCGMAASSWALVAVLLERIPESGAVAEVRELGAEHGSVSLLDITVMTLRTSRRGRISAALTDPVTPR